MEQHNLNNLFDLLRLNGKTIWVAGGAGYLGQTTVKILLSAGARVLCIDLAGKAEDFVASLSQVDGKAIAATRTAGFRRDDSSQPRSACRFSA